MEMTQALVRCADFSHLLVHALMPPTLLSKTLDTWRGVAVSRWKHTPTKTQVSASTVVDSASSTIAMSATTTTTTTTMTTTTPSVGVSLDFGYPGSSDCNDFSHPFAHTTSVVSRSSDGAYIVLRREIDMEVHTVACRATGATWSVDTSSPHRFVAVPKDSSWSISCTWSDPNDAPLPAAPPGGWSVDAIVSRTADEWARFWGGGAFVDLAGVALAAGDATADQVELERRVILSLYLMRAHEYGNLPPQETALIHNTWNGKHHQEMRYWHQAHWAMWGRNEPLVLSDEWYISALPNATWYVRITRRASFCHKIFKLISVKVLACGSMCTSMFLRVQSLLRALSGPGR
jgi:hypothetical protein